MPLLSQPWANPTDESSRVVALAGSMPPGVAFSMVQGIFFLGPFAIGAVFWEIVSGFPGDAYTAYRYANARSEGGGPSGWSVSSRLTASLSRILTFCFLTIYISYTHGATDVACQAWPRAIAAMSALALSTSVGCFVLKAIGMARLNNLELGVLGGLFLVQLIIPLIAVHAWTGGLTESRSACYLRIHSWFGIFSLLPLITLAFVLGLLVVGHTNEKYRFSSIIAQRTSLSTSRSSRSGSLGTSGHTSRDRPISDRPISERPISNQSRVHADRMYQKNQNGWPHRTSDGPEAGDIERSFLRLSGEDGDTFDSRTTDRERRARSFFLRFGSLWGFAFLAILAGTIIGFMKAAPILIFVYQPVLTTLPVLCASRLSKLQFGPSSRKKLSAFSAPSNASREANLTEKGIQPQPFMLRSSIRSPSAASTRDRSAPGSRARALVHQLSGRSLRAHLRSQRRSEDSDRSRPPSSMKNQISYPFTPEPAHTPAEAMLASGSGSGSTPYYGAAFMSRGFSDDPGRAVEMQTSSDVLRNSGFNSINSGNNGLSWTPKSAPLGLTPQPARRKYPSLSASGSDRSSGEAAGSASNHGGGGGGGGGFEAARKAPFNLLTPPVEQRGSFPRPPSPAEPVLSPTELLSPPMRELNSPVSNKQGNSWPASNESEGKGGHMSSTRRSSDLERQDEESLRELQNLDQGEPDDGAENDMPWRASQNPHRASFAEMSLNNPRDRSIELSDSDGDHVRRAAAALTGHKLTGGSASAAGSGDERGSQHSRTREPSIRSLAVSIEDADEDDLRRVIDERGFARTAPTATSLSKEEKFQRALSLRAAGAAQQKGNSAPGAAAGGGDSQSQGLGLLPPPDTHGGQAASEASFGAAEISHNPRLQRLESMGRKPRTNPFQRRTPGETRLTPDDRQGSDQSGSSGPSQVTGITGSSGGTEGTSGSGSGNSRSTGPSYDLRTHAQRVGVGERGGAPSPIKQISSKKLAAAAAAAAGAAGNSQGRPSTSSTSKRPQQTKKSKASNHSASDGGKSADSNGTFGMRSTDRQQPQMPM